MFVCNPGESDESLSGTDEEEQELWEETQIGKGVTRLPGEQVLRDQSLSGPPLIFWPHQ